MKLLFVALSILCAAATAEARNYRILCGVGSAANPHGGDGAIVALYKHANMDSYRMMFWIKGFVHVEENIVVEESVIEPVAQWPLLTATMRGPHEGTLHTFKMAITNMTGLSEDPNAHGNYEFSAEGELEMSLAGGKKFALVCDGIFSRD